MKRKKTIEREMNDRRYCHGCTHEVRPGVKVQIRDIGLHHAGHGNARRKGNMKKAIQILKQHVRSYQGHIDLFEANPNNQAITKYSADEARKNIEDLNKAIARLEELEALAASTSDNRPKV